MSDSQKFPVAVHILVYMALKGAVSREKALSSSVLATTIPTHPVVVRRIMTSLSRAGLITTCSGVSGGAWLIKEPSMIFLDEVLVAVDGCAHLGLVPLGAEGCPLSQAIPRSVSAALNTANQAAKDALRAITIEGLKCSISLTPKE